MPGRSNRLIWLAVLILMAMGACSQQEASPEQEGAGSVDVSDEPVILPADARQIIDDWQTRSDEANEVLDLQLQDSLETSPAREYDDAYFTRLKAQGKTTAGQNARRVADATVYVPRQTEYPARFLAYVTLASIDDPEDGDIARLRMYEKSAQDEPWKLAIYITLPDDFEAPNIPVDADGFAQTLSTDQIDNLKIAPERVPDELATYLSAYADDAAESVFAPGRYTTEERAGFKRDAEQNASASIDYSVEVAAGDHPVLAFPTEDGALVVFGLSVVDIFNAAPGQTLRPSRGSEGLLEEGEYTSIRRNNIEMVFATVPPAASDGLVEIVRSTGGVVSFEGDPLGSDQT